MKSTVAAHGCAVRGLSVSFGGVVGPSACFWGSYFQFAKTAMIDTRTRFNYDRLRNSPELQLLTAP
jgi:hypothetical protein